jgi:hypothetical protein
MVALWATDERIKEETLAAWIYRTKAGDGKASD